MATEFELDAKEYIEAMEQEELLNNNVTCVEGFVTLRLRADTLKNSPIVHRRSRIEEILSRPEVAAALVNEGIKGAATNKHRLPSSPFPTANQKFSFDDVNVEETNENEADKLSDISSTYSEDSPLQSANSLTTKFDIAANNSSSSSGENISENKPPSVLGQVSKEDNVSDTSSIKSPLKSKKNIFTRFRFPSNRNLEVENVTDEWQSLERAKARVDENHRDFPLATTFIPILKEPGTRSTMHKKTVSFSRLPSESLIKNSADCVTLMQNGHHFVKLRSNSRVYNRFYWFEASTNCLHWEPSKKDQYKAKIGIPSIKEVRSGKATESFIGSDISSHFPDECAFSIIYGEYKNLDLIASSPDEANIWITGLRCLLAGKNVDELQCAKDSRDLWLESVFDSADANKDGFLDESESLELLKSLSDGIRETRIKQKLTELLRFKKENKSQITRQEFVEVFKDVTTRPEIYFLLARYSSEDDILSVNDLQLFMETEQGMLHASKDNCLKLINTHEPSSELRSVPALGIDGFTKYLMSQQCNIFAPGHTQVCQDMNHPLSHYFIASSHNTYLMEDQLNGPCSISAYVRALLRCCRCIELDCWDGEEGEPIIAMAQDSSNNIKFEQAIEAINESAFKNSPYPVILCIDNHCSLEQQRLIATTLNTVLKDKIYTEDFDSQSEYLPSPESLKHKFLIRLPKLPDGGDTEGMVINETDNLHNDEAPLSPIKYSKKQDFEPPEPQQLVLAKELSDLVCLCVNNRIHDHNEITKCQQTLEVVDFTSITERTASRIADSHPEEYVNHCKRFLTRVHPSPGRFDSSNFNPQDFWNCGVQIASLNYQTPGLMMDINDGRFSMNGGCGYVLKPAIMRDEVAYFNAHSADINPGIAPKTLHLRIISGQEFPKPRGGGAKGQVIDPYVLIELFGMSADCSEQRTRTAHDCGSGLLSAIFDESFEFHLTVPELALVRFVVLDDEFIGDEFIGQYTIPFECLQSGYRHLRLRSIFDEPLENATLFVHIHITDTYTIYPNVSNATQTPSSPGLSSSTGGSMKFSSKKMKSKKVQQSQQARRMRACTIRNVGIQKVDALFKLVENPLKDANEIKEKFQLSLHHFKEICGLTMLSSIKHCMRILSTRAVNQNKDLLSRKHSNGSAQPKQSSLSENIRVNYDATLDLVQLEVGSSCANETWRKVVIGFNTLITDAQRLMKTSPSIQRKLSEIQTEALKQHELIPAMLTTKTNQTGKRKKKLTKKTSTTTIGGERYNESNFAWNCSVIRGHLDSLKSSKHDAELTLCNICDSAVDLDMISTDPVDEFKLRLKTYGEKHNSSQDLSNGGDSEESTNGSTKSVSPSPQNSNNNNMQCGSTASSETDDGDNVFHAEKRATKHEISKSDILPVTTL